jgi:hypothetical protein
MRTAQAALADPEGWRMIREGVEVKLIEGTVPETLHLMSLGRSACEGARDA